MNCIPTTGALSGSWKLAAYRLPTPASSRQSPMTRPDGYRPMSRNMRCVPFWTAVRGHRETPIPLARNHSHATRVHHAVHARTSEHAWGVGESGGAITVDEALRAFTWMRPAPVSRKTSTALSPWASTPTSPYSTRIPNDTATGVLDDNCRDRHHRRLRGRRRRSVTARGRPERLDLFASGPRSASACASARSRWTAARRSPSAPRPHR